MLDIPSFNTKKELFKYLLENKQLILTEKKTQLKHGDVLTYSPSIETATTKASNSEGLTVKAAINTINVLDSHGDVHLKGIWNKTVKENKAPFLLQEHEMKFDKIISDKVKASVKTLSWKELGVNASGITEVLMFEAKIDENRNPFMAKQYRNNWVKNHSVGMQYVKIKLAINDEEAKEEFEEWNKNIDNIINKEEAEARGYFFAIYEAKMIEGSAVPIGSNRMTPTMEMSDKDIEPDKSTHKDEPPKGTQNESNVFINQNLF